VRTDDERAARAQRPRELAADIPLQFAGEVREDEVPAERKVERAVRSPGSNVVPEEVDRLAIPGAQTAVLECACPDPGWQVAQTALGIASPPRTLEQHRIHVRRHDVDLDARLCGGENERIGLLARRAAGAPSRDGRAKLGQHLVPKHLEHSPVPPETGDRDPAEGGEHFPFLFVAFEVGTVGVGPAQSELSGSPGDAPADLAAHSAEALPAQSEPRKRPLEEVNALGVRHARRVPDVNERPVRLLVEGRPAVGKTTVASRLAALLRDTGNPVAGFLTKELREGGRRVGFAIETFDSADAAVLAHVDLAGPPRVGKYGVDVAAFERVAVPAVASASDRGVVVIDELGKMELASDAFRAAVSELFELPVALVATVHVARHPFTDPLKRRPNVEIVRVTARNRDELPARLAARLGVDRVES
jgi:nucleoside-triphosphatase